MRRRRGVITAVLAGLIGLTAPAPAFGAEQIFGFVNDVNSAAAIAGFEVDAHNLDTGEIFSECTKADGSYSIKIPPGNYKLLYQGPRRYNAACDANLTYASTWHVINGGATTVEEGRAFFVAPQATYPAGFYNAHLGGAMTGRVIRQGTDTGLGFVTVSVRSLENYVAATLCTDANGNFTGSRLFPTSYKVEFNSQGSCGLAGSTSRSSMTGARPGTTPRWCPSRRTGPSRGSTERSPARPTNSPSPMPARAAGRSRATRASPARWRAPSR